MNKVPVTVECGHVVKVYEVSKHLLQVGAEIWCPTCRRYQLVPGTTPTWYVKCQNCKRTWYKSINRAAALFAAQRHANRYTGHKVSIGAEGTKETEVPSNLESLGMW